MLRERNMAVVYADSDEFPCIDEQTADFTYARLQRSQDDVETGYDANALDGWAKQARVWAKGNRDVYIFFITGAKVRNPAAAQALIAKLSRSEEHTSELQSLMRISYAALCMKKKTTTKI